MFLINYCTFLSHGCSKVLPFIIIFFAFAVIFIFISRIFRAQNFRSVSVSEYKGKEISREIKVSAYFSH